MIPENYIPQQLTYLDHNDFCEIGCLASMYMRPSVARNVLAEEGITAEHFQESKNREIFEIFESEITAGRELDVRAIIKKLESAVYASLPYLTDIIESITNLSGSNYPYYCQLIREQYAARLNRIRNQEAINMSSLGASPEELTEFNAETTKLMQNELARRSKATESKRSLEELLERMERDEEPDRFGFGLRELDFVLSRGGAERGEFLVVGAPTSQGKSTLLLMAAVNALEQGRTVVIISLEMSGHAVMRRLLSNYVGAPILDNAQFPSAQLKDARSRAYVWMHGQVEAGKIILVESQPSIVLIDSLIRSTNCDLVILDYIQLVQIPQRKGETREATLNELSNGLKDLARRTQKTIFTASQLNEAGALRDSRAIGFAADFVLLIESDADGELQILVQKNRNGAAGHVIPVRLRGELGRFESRD